MRSKKDENQNPEVGSEEQNKNEQLNTDVNSGEETPSEETPKKTSSKKSVSKEETPSEEKTSLVSDDIILKAKKLNPHYDKFYINAKGFVFVPGTPKKMMGEAILVENEFYNK